MEIGRTIPKTQTDYLIYPTKWQYFHRKASFLECRSDMRNQSGGRFANFSCAEPLT